MGKPPLLGAGSSGAAVGCGALVGICATATAEVGVDVNVGKLKVEVGTFVVGGATGVGGPDSIGSESMLPETTTSALATHPAESW